MKMLTGDVPVTSGDASVDSHSVYRDMAAVRQVCDKSYRDMAAMRQVCEDRSYRGTCDIVVRVMLILSRHV